MNNHETALLNQAHLVSPRGHRNQMIEDRKINPLDPTRLRLAKAAHTTRRVPLEAAKVLISGDVKPRAGDLVLARIDRFGQHKRIEMSTGRRSPLFLGDEVILCYGDRYAPDQFEGVVPDDLSPCSMVAGGGIASRVLHKHSSVKCATRITPIGLLGYNSGAAINIADYALPAVRMHDRLPMTIASVGTSMNAGKTTSAAFLIKGLVRKGLKVGAAKLTGTGSGGDTWLMRDAGATLVLDFTDVGYASTYKVPLKELEQIATTLIAHLQAEDVDAIVLEVADGLFQAETCALLCSRLFHRTIDGVMFAAGDAMGAVAGVNWLYDHGLPVIAISGALTASPLAIEEARSATGLPVLGLAELSDPEIDEFVKQQINSQVETRRVG